VSRPRRGSRRFEIEAYPVGESPASPPLRRTFSFITYEKARRFTDDVTALEYQNCLVNEHS
jgi:hypothetical protein